MEPFSCLILGVLLCSFLLFQWLFHYVSPWASARFSAGFLQLRPKHKVEWNSRMVSSIHALVVGTFCLYILVFDDAIKEDPIWGDPTLVNLNVGITTGYLISDLLLMGYYWTAIGEKVFVLHHMAGLYAAYYVLGHGLLSYFANIRLMAELSTPCVNQRWFFDVLGYPKSSCPNMANGLLMTLAFFLVRIAVIPIYYSHMWSVYGTAAYYGVSTGARAAWIVSSVCLDVMNVMWMHKIVRGCYRVLHTSAGYETAPSIPNGELEKLLMPLQ